MDLSLFFDPLPEKFNELTSGAPNLGQSIFGYFSKMPELEGMHLALIGLKENRSMDTKPSGVVDAADSIREQLYSLQKGSASYKIADLGNLRNGPTFDDTVQRVQEVCALLIEKGIVPILFGSTHDITLAQVQAYEELDKSINILIADATFDLEESEPTKSHLRNLINKNSKQIFQLTHLAHQSYLVSEELFSLMESLQFETIRLGAVKEKLPEMEPLIRDADLLSFDLSAISHQFMPAGIDSKVYGLSGEEACQICWYAGLNDKLSSVGFYGMDRDLDDSRSTGAFVTATMIWYFIEGYYHRSNDKDFQSANFMIYEVSMSGEPESIRFFKSNRSEKWWMEVPNEENENSVFLRNKMVPCSYADYEAALEGEVPPRWLSAFVRLN